MRHGCPVVSAPAELRRQTPDVSKAIPDAKSTMARGEKVGDVQSAGAGLETS